MWELGEWHHGWQYYASCCSEYHYRETVVLAQSCAADQAHLRSHSGPGLLMCFWVAQRVSLSCNWSFSARWLWRGYDFFCNSQSCMRHKVGFTRKAPGGMSKKKKKACPRSGLLRIRATPTERTLARVCREAGATVRCNTKLRYLNIGVSVQDERAIEVVASGLPFHHGAQFAVDITLRSATTFVPDLVDLFRES